MGKLYKAYLLSYHPEIMEDRQFMDCIADLFNTPEIQGLEKFEQHLLINRLQHITSVSYLSFRICRKLRWDWHTAARGGILHDLFYYDWRENDRSHRPHGYLHPGFALKNARELCGALDRKTENIIIRHMWPLTPIPPRYKEAFIVSLADKYCASRELYVSLSKKYRIRFYKSIGLTE
ncbi:MAG: HD domain-containing protein [Clostridiales bacterium]|nr:HD domain-containing protein [Clostridiales bacterium]